MTHIVEELLALIFLCGVAWVAYQFLCNNGDDPTDNDDANAGDR